MGEVINTRLVNVNVQANNQNEVFEQLGKLMYAEGRVNDFDTYIENVKNREDICSTGIGFSIAIPHGKTDAVNEPTIAFGRLEKPIDWKSFDGELVNIVFLLAVPEACKGDVHLRIIANLSRKLIHKDFRESLNSATSPEEVIALVESCFDIKEGVY